MSAVLDKIVSCPSLPSLPAVAIEVLELTRDPNVSIKEIAKVVENDQAIAAKVLRTINSSYYGLASPCPTIQRAMGYLGLNTVRSLVLGFSLVDSFKDTKSEGAFDLEAHWRRAIFGATAARTSANRACATDPDEAFIASMLQDVGMLAASMALGEEYNEAIAGNEDDHFSVEQLEMEQFEFTHSEAGALLAERWRLPECMIQAVRHHHNPENSPPEFRDLIHTVALSTIAAESLTVETPKALIHRFKNLGNDWFDLPVDGAEDLLSTISQGAGELARLFQLDTGVTPDVASIMAEAEDQKIATHISMERERQDLESTASDLEKQSLTDGLTGIANRKKFDDVLNAAFAATSNGGSLAIIFMDVDKFKLVNDTHGHQAGDKVLVELARRASEAAGENSIVCRYGGEEFAVIAPNTDRIGGARIAESIRKVIEATTFDLRSVPDCPEDLPITISLGVAAIDDSVPGAFPDAVSLLKAADTAVYAAKKGGRNCTRVYNAAKARKSAPGQPGAAPMKQQAPASPAVPMQSPSSPVVALTSSRGAITVLLIEDDPLQRSLLKSVLANVPNVDACTAESSEQAMLLLGLGEASELGSGLKPNIVICDLTLPDCSGIDLIKQIRVSGEHAATPLVVLSSTDENESVQQCIEAGANAFISKQRLAENPNAVISNLIGFWSTAQLAA